MTHGPPATHDTHDAAIAAATALVPDLRARAQDADTRRGVPAPTVDAVRDAGLFDLLTPRAWGGSELGFGTTLLATAELARGCPSTAWLRAVMGGNTWAVAQMAEQAQKEVFAGPSGLIALQLRIGGPPARRVAGGFALDAMSGRFCSGIDHADWILIGAGVADSPEDTAGVPHVMLVPVTEVTVTDDWFTTGLRGTGSRAVRFSGVVVPEHRALPRAALDPASTLGAHRPPGVVYRQEFSTIGTVALAGVLLGAARAVLEDYGARLPDEVAELRWCSGGAEIDSAQALLLDAIGELAESDTPGGTPTQRARLRRDTAFAAGRCRAVVNDVYAASGAVPMYDGSVLQRLWRDVNTAAQHATFDLTRWSRLYARTALARP